MTKVTLAVAFIALATCVSSLVPQQAQAQANNYVSIFCNTNNCSALNHLPGVRVSQIAWAFNPNGTDLVVPNYCDDQRSCAFYCPSHPGTITAHVIMYGIDINNQEQLLGTASAQAVCAPM